MNKSNILIEVEEYGVSAGSCVQDNPSWLRHNPLAKDEYWIQILISCDSEWCCRCCIQSISLQAKMKCSDTAETEIVLVVVQTDHGYFCGKLVVDFC